jgi:hypothetical protein
VDEHSTRPEADTAQPTIEPDLILTKEEIGRVRNDALVCRARLENLERYHDSYWEPGPELRRALELWKGPYGLADRARGEGVPMRHWFAALDPPAKQTGAIVAVRSFVAEAQRPDGRRALVLAGPTGVGKTFAAVAGIKLLGREYLHYDPRRAGRYFAFFHVPELQRRLLDFDEVDDALEEACAPVPIVLDDFDDGFIRVDGRAQPLLEEILWRREAENAVTLVTTNLTRKQLLEIVSDRLADRLEGGWARVVELPGASLRRRTS